jgi:hypothetical protein
VTGSVHPIVLSLAAPALRPGPARVVGGQWMCVGRRFEPME